MGKGGGGGGPQVTKSETSNIPEYAKPYVMNMLGAAQNQIFDTTAGGRDIWGNPTPGTITGFKPYQAYSSNPQDYFAGPSALQNSAYNAAGQLQSPGQYQVGSQLAAQAGLGQMGAGRQFQQQATNPFAVQAYMSPYMQNVVDTQKLGALRDYQTATPARMAQQTRQGAFGGSRSAIENSEAQRNLMSQLQGIQATGTQQAFQNAQAQQQFGANLGLQGLQGAGQAAATLGQLGTSQNAADLANINLQNQLGGQQQQYQQNIINQAIQDYATAQQYPYMQLGTMSNLLRGLPMQSMSTQQYQAAPSAMSQLGGLGATALGVYGASGGFKAAKGGEVKSYAEGGVVGNIDSQLYQMDAAQLVQIMKTSASQSIRQKAAEILAQKQQAQQVEKQQGVGIDTLPAGNLDDIGMADGGIVAFSGEDGSLVKRKREPAQYDFSTQLGLTGDRGYDYENSPMVKAERELADREAKNKELTSSIFGPIANFLLPGREYYAGTADGKIDVKPDMVKGNKPADSAAPAASVVPPAPPTGKGIPVPSNAGKYEKEIEAGLAQLKKGLGEGRSQADLDALREEIKGNQDQKLWLSLIQGGAKAMQSTSPYAMVGLGAGLEEGAKTYGKGMEAERADKKLLLAQQSALEQVEYARKSGNLNALIQAQARLDGIQAQRENLGASKELAILSAREKARGEMIQRLMYQNSMDEEAATALANKTYPSTIGTATATSEAVPKGVVVRKKSS